MKSKIRIKICQESDKAKKIRSAILECNKERSFELRKELSKQDKKIDFYKKLNDYL